MYTVSQLIARIDMDIQGFMSGVATAEAAMSHLYQHIKRVGQQIATNTASPWNSVYKMASGAISGVIGHLRNLSTKLLDTGEGFNYLAFIASMAIVNVGKSVVDLGFQFIELQDKSERAFTAMLGDAAKAKSFFQELKNFAIPTPFETPDLVQNAQRMLDVLGKDKLDSIIPSIKAIGDYMTFKGAGKEHMDGVMKAFIDMLVKGKVSSEELVRQLGNHMVPGMKLLAAQAGVTTKEMSELVSKGAVPAEWAFKAITYQMEKAAPEAMRKGAKDMSTVMSGLKDRARDTFSTLFRPLYRGVVEAADFLSEKFQLVTNVISNLSDATKNKITIGTAIVAAIAPATVAIEAMTRVFRLSINPIGVVVTALAALAFYISQNASMAKVFAPVMELIGNLSANLVNELSELATSMGRSLVPVFIVLAKVAAVVLEGVVRLLHWFNSFSDQTKTTVIVLQLMLAAFNPISMAVSAVVASFAGLNVALRILSVNSLPLALRYFSRFGGSMGAVSKVVLTLGFLLNGLGHIVSTLISPFTRLALSVGANFKAMWTAITGGITVAGLKARFAGMFLAISTTVTEVVKSIAASLSMIPVMAAGAMASLRTAFYTGMATVFTALANGFAAMEVASAAFFSRIYAFGTVRGIFRAAMVGMLNAMLPFSSALRVLVNGLSWVREAIVMGIMPASRLMAASVVVIEQAVMLAYIQIAGFTRVLLALPGTLLLAAGSALQMGAATALAAIQAGYLAVAQRLLSFNLNVSIVAMNLHWIALRNKLIPAFITAQTAVMSFITRGLVAMQASIATLIPRIVAMGNALIFSLARGWNIALASSVAFIRGGAGMKAFFASMATSLKAINWTLMIVIGAIAIFAASWKGNVGNLQGKTKAFIDNFVVGFRLLWKIFAETLPGLLNSFVQFIGGIWHEIVRGWDYLVNRLIAGIAFWDKTWETAAKSLGVFGKAANAVFGNVGTNAGGMFDAVKKAWDSTGIPGAVGGYFDDLKNEFNLEKEKYLKETGGGFDPKNAIMSLGKITGLADLMKYAVADPGKMPQQTEESEAKKRAKKLAEDYQSTVHDLLKKKSVAERLLGKDSDYARVSFETQYGTLAKLNAKQKAYVVNLAQMTDSAEAMADAHKQLVEVQKALTIATKMGGDQSEAARLKAEMTYTLDEKVLGMHKKKTEGFIAQAVAAQRLLTFTNSISDADAKISLANMSSEMREFADSMGGVSNIINLSASQTELAMAKFRKLRSLNIVNNLTQSLNDLHVSMRLIDDPTKKSAIDFVGGYDTWNKLPEAIRGVVKSFVSMSDALRTMREMALGSREELWSALVPNATEFQKAERALKQYIDQMDAHAKLQLELGHPIDPKSLDTSYLTDIIDKSTSANVPGGDWFKNLYRGPESTSISNAKQYKEEILETKKIIDEIAANRQLGLWAEDINAKIIDLNAMSAGTYRKAESDIRDFLYQNRDAIEKTRQSFDQMGKSSEFDGWLELLTQRMRDLNRETIFFQSKVAVFQRGSEAVRDLQTMVAGSDLDAYVNSMKEFNSETMQMGLPRGLEKESYATIQSLLSVTEQLKTAATSTEETFRTLAKATSNEVGALLVDFTKLNLVTSSLEYPDDFNRELALSVVNARLALDAFTGAQSKYMELSKQLQIMKTGSTWGAELVDEMTFNGSTGLWELPKYFDEKFAKRMRDIRQEMGMITDISSALVDSLFQGVTRALQPDTEAYGKLKSIKDELRQANRLMWNADEKDKANIADQIAYLEGEADKLNQRLNGGIKQMFGTLVTEMYNTFTTTLQNMAADILKGELRKNLESVFTKLLKVDIGAGPDTQQVTTAANTAALTASTAATVAASTGTAALALSMQTLTVSLGTLPVALTTVSTSILASQSASMIALTTNTAALWNLTAALYSAAAGGFGGMAGATFLEEVPGLATGGTALSNKTYLVGEKGPELVKFNRSATVYPNGVNPDAGSGGHTFNITINGVRDVEGFRRSMPLVMEEAARSANAAFERNM